MIFSEPYDTTDDQALLSHALAGNKKALEQLIKRHQDYIFNISLRLFGDPDDALDATQEVLIKVITHLKTFRGESEFRTWLYRIALNHFLNCSQRKVEATARSRMEAASGRWSPDANESPDEEVVEEVRILCATAMLMCLNREQRLLYIIGEIFRADHILGASLFDLTPANYRVKLHRAKQDLIAFVSGRCGLVDPRNPCRCPKKAKFLIEKGWVDKTTLRFNTQYEKRVRQMVKEKKDEISDDVQLRMGALFGETPFQIKEELDRLLYSVVV